MYFCLIDGCHDDRRIIGSLEVRVQHFYNDFSSILNLLSNTLTHGAFYLSSFLLKAFFARFRVSLDWRRSFKSVKGLAVL